MGAGEARTSSLVKDSISGLADSIKVKGGA